MIPRETVDRILDAAQIVDVIGDFVTLRRSGAEFVACCPFHNEKTPSFHVSPSKGIFKCFGCGKGGSVVNFLMEHETLTYSEALKWLAKKYHIEVVEREETAEELAVRQKGESLMLVTDFAAKFFAEQLKTTDGRAIAHAYFRSRGLEDATIAKFGLGWAPKGWDTLSRAAREAGYKEEFLVETGLSVKRDDGRLSDRFCERVMFPICSDSGRVIAFGGRTLSSEKSIAKYVNSHESEIYKKSRTLYGINFAKGEISKRKKCYLVEGYLDVISMHQLGVTNVVASSGTSLTSEQVRLVRKFTENVTIIYDGDPAGIHAALRGIDLVLKEGLNVKIVLLPEGDDPDSYSRKHTLAEVTDYIESNEKDFIVFKTDLLLGDAGDDPLKKAELINDIADTIALIPDAVKRATYMESTSQRFKIDSNILQRRISSTREAILLEEKRQRDRERAERQRAAEAGWDQDGGYVGQNGGQGGSGGYDDGYGGSYDRGQNDGRGGQNWGQGNGYGSSQGTAQGGSQGGVRNSMIFNAPRLQPCEKELLGFILNNGQDLLRFDPDSEFYVEGEEPSDVADFIDSALAFDNLLFENKIYRDIYDQYFDYYEQGLTQEQILSRLMEGPDENVSKITEDIIIPKYGLSVKSFENSITKQSTQLVMFVPRSILVYKRLRVKEEILAVTAELSALSADDVEKSEAKMMELKELNEIVSGLNEKLDRRLRKNSINRNGEE